MSHKVHKMRHIIKDKANGQRRLLLGLLIFLLWLSLHYPKRFISLGQEVEQIEKESEWALPRNCSLSCLGKTKSRRAGRSFNLLDGELPQLESCGRRLGPEIRRDSFIPEAEFSRFLGIMLRVLRLGLPHTMFILQSSFKPLLRGGGGVKFVSRGDCE